MKEYKYNSGFRTYRIRLRKTAYASNGNLAVTMENYEDEFGCWEPYAALTVNLVPLPESDLACIDVNNLNCCGGNIEAFLTDNKIAEATGTVIPSGWCEYPLFKFDLSVFDE